MAKRKKEELKEEDKRRLTKTGLRQLIGIFRFMLPYKGIFIVGLVALALSSLILLAFPRLAGELLDVASGKPRYFGSIDQVALALLLILLIQSVFSFVRVYTFSIVSEKGMAAVREAVYRKVIWLPMTFFDSRRHSVVPLPRIVYLIRDLCVVWRNRCCRLVWSQPRSIQ